MNRDKLTNKSQSINIPFQQKQSSSLQQFSHEDNQIEKITKSTHRNDQTPHMVRTYRHRLKIINRPKANGTMSAQIKTTASQIKSDGHQKSTNIRHQQFQPATAESSAINIPASEIKIRIVKTLRRMAILKTDQFTVQTLSLLTRSKHSLMQISSRGSSMTSMSSLSSALSGSSTSPQSCLSSNAMHRGTHNSSMFLLSRGSPISWGRSSGPTQSYFS